MDVQDVLYQSRNPTRRYLHRRRRSWILRQIEAWAPRTDARNALEVGPGSGCYLPALCRRFRAVVASDIVPEFLERACQIGKSLPNLTTVADDIAATRHEPGSMDLVLCTEVLEHIPNIEPVIPSLARILSPRGVLILTTPQSWSSVEVAARVMRLPGMTYLVRSVYGEPVDDLHHVSTQSHRGLVARLQASGLAIQASERFGLYVPGFAELGGRIAARCARRLESAIARSPGAGVLWTQAYVLRRAI